MKGLCLAAVLGLAATAGAGALEKDYAAYLFAYFTGNRVEEEQVRFAISPDGFQYFALNGGRPVIDSKTVSSTGGLRDPHILRREEGDAFYMVATDMTASKGWDSNRAMVLMRSDDLVTWRAAVVDVQKRYAGQEGLKRVWAPQTVFDAEAGKYMVYWSMKHGNGPDIIYYAYANAAFDDLEGEPKPLFVPRDGKPCIDGDIVLKNGIYHLFYKTEGAGNGIRKAMTDSLTAGRWIEQPGYKQLTADPVEGSAVFKLANSDTYVLMYDVYTKGRYEFAESVDLDRFTRPGRRVTMDFKPRHGSVLPVTRRELLALTDKWGVPEGYPALPNNPVLEGYFADPDVLYAEKTGRYYIYPTSDGFLNWGGTYFKAFSSDNLRHWRDEGVILDLKKDVAWADRNAWAPCVIECKQEDGAYRYFYYFTAAQKIGVAVADSPLGPFVDSGKPLVDFKPPGVRGGQEIDPEVFFDPVGKRHYFYWGNGYLAGAELNADMVSLNRETLTVMTPDKTFREGVTVFFRGGTYYFLWSENDTRSADYRVRYATADSPLGPLRIPAENLVLAKDVTKGIYGTGHNAVLQVPGKDEWYIVYHRFSRPNGIAMGEAAGYHREVCMDKLAFGEDGAILRVEPTL